MAVDMFAKIGDIKGEALDAKHKEEIECLSWSWGVAQTGTMAVGAGGGAGKASFSDITFTHNVDKASPNLLKYCASGKHIPDATLTARKAGGEQQEYLVVKLTDVLISNVQSSGSAGGDLSEIVSLNFSKVELEYKPQKADGSLDAGLFFKYDLKQNKTL
jgi:type VI secretion system secreted protein Hcp